MSKKLSNLTVIFVLIIPLSVAAQARNPVSSGASSQLTSGSDTCMGSSMGGAQAISFGFSIGGTWLDSDCVRRKDATSLYNMGHKKAALVLMCQNENVRNAMQSAGDICPGNYTKKEKVSEDTYPSDKSIADKNLEYWNHN